MVLTGMSIYGNFLILSYKIAIVIKKVVRKKEDKAISMMRGKSPPSEFILEIIKSNNSLSLLKEFGNRDNFILSHNIILFYFFTFI